MKYSLLCCAILSLFGCSVSQMIDPRRIVEDGTVIEIRSPRDKEYLEYYRCESGRPWECRGISKNNMTCRCPLF